MSEKIINKVVDETVDTIIDKIDEDNDIYEITINNVTYTLDDIYDSKYSELFDELNLLIDKY